MSLANNSFLLPTCLMSRTKTAGEGQGRNVLTASTLAGKLQREGVGFRGGQLEPSEKTQFQKQTVRNHTKKPAVCHKEELDLE